LNQYPTKVSSVGSEAPKHIGSLTPSANRNANSQHVVTNGQLLARIREIRAEKTKEAAAAKPATLFGVKLPSLSTISFSHIARGLQPTDQPLDPPPAPLPDFSKAAEQPSPIEEALAEAPDAILDERAAKLLEEAERMDSNILDDSVPLSELARGSLSPEA